ncbi:hypothetical protein QO034_10840 [Sedimentitalea sp. JM2-8]|uniref:Uncharacterized protein n=1 Tax=Sedimentitalea xiamensis TaxID=3050037 RepID=A0ABT7FF54_9RHOB|nr:hypothetical protein [Sedimentitalea xiamensis]MDK3073608.1 hypothetical protein [Sedimentitalea xiamensis]
MRVAKAAIDLSALPDMRALLAAQQVLAGTLKTEKGEADPQTEAHRLRKEKVRLQAAEAALRDRIARSRQLQAGLTQRIDAEKSVLQDAQSALTVDEDTLLLLNADIRDLQREVDSANMSRLDLEAAYPALARPVPDLPDAIRDWIAEFQGITPNPAVSKSIHKTYFLAVSRLQTEGAKLKALDAERAALVSNAEAQRKKRDAAQRSVDTMIAEATALKQKIRKDANDARAAADAAEQCDIDLVPVAARAMTVQDAKSVIDQMNAALAGAFSQLADTAKTLSAALDGIAEDAPVADTGLTRKSFQDRLSARRNESDFIGKSAAKGDTALGISRIFDLIAGLDQDVDAGNAALRRKRSDDNRPRLIAAARASAEQIAALPREGDPVPVDDLLIDEAVLEGLEQGLDDSADIDTLTPEIEAQIEAKLKEILDARASKAKAEALAQRKLQREAERQAILLLREDPAFKELVPMVRNTIVVDCAGKALTGKATVATATADLNAALLAQYKPANAEIWKKALGIIGKSFPDSGSTYADCAIHVSFFGGNLSSDANGVLEARKPNGDPVNVDTLLDSLLKRSTITARVHATLETGANKTPKVYYPGNDFTTETRHFTALGGQQAVRDALNDYLQNTIKPRLQTFIDNYGRL